MTEQEALTLLTKAKTQLLLSQPFFATLLLRMTFEATDKTPIMATDGVKLYFNPNGLDGMDMDTLKGVLCHESLHPSLCHHTRRQARDPEGWNIACDHPINNIVKSAGMQLPKGHLDNPAYAGKYAEEIYNLIPKSGGGGGQGKPGGKGGADFGQVWNAPADQKDTQEHEWRLTLSQAIQAARSCGSLPAGIDQLVEIVKGPRSSWFDRLKKFIAETHVADYTWSRPSRRTTSLGIYLPSVTKEGVGHIDIAIDCSGSISDRELQEFGGKFAALHEELKPELVRAIYFDAIVQNTREFGPEDTVTFDVKGRGGTDVRTVFDWINQSGKLPKCLVVLTDLETPFPDAPPAFPTLWVTVNQHTAPFGDVAYLEVN